MPQSVAEPREAPGAGQGDRAAGLTPEEDEHVGDSCEQGAAQAAANTHAGPRGLQADHLVHRGHQLRRVLPFQPETGHKAVNRLKSPEEPPERPPFQQKEEEGGAGKPPLADK